MGKGSVAPASRYYNSHNSDMLSDISSSVATVSSSSDRQMMSHRPSLLETSVTMGNLTSDHQLLLDRNINSSNISSGQKHRLTITEIYIHHVHHQTHVHIDKYSSSNTINNLYSKFYIHTS
jgi:hypothetical protein